MCYPRQRAQISRQGVPCVSVRVTFLVEGVPGVSVRARVRLPPLTCNIEGEEEANKEEAKLKRMSAEVSWRSGS